MLEQRNGENWTGWGSWGRCSVFCGLGIQWRTRKCTYTGLGSIRGCDGPSKQNRTCTMGGCPGESFIQKEDMPTKTT